MDQKKLDRLWKALEEARRSPQTADDLESLAAMAERSTRMGKHVMWVSPFPHRPFPIPRHGKEPVAKHVRKVVLDALSADAAAWEEVLAPTEHKKNGNGES
jgi:hypothetical protein